MINRLKYRYVLMHMPLEDEGMIYNHTLIFFHTCYSYKVVLSEAGEKPDLLIHEQLLLVLVHTLTVCYSTGEKNRNRNKRQPTANSQERTRFQKP